MNGPSWFERTILTDNQRRLFEQERLILEATEGICEAMEAKGLTRADLARRIGKSRAYVTQILSGARNMTLRTLADVFFVCGARVQVSNEPLSATSFVFNEGTDTVAVQVPEQPWHSMSVACLDEGWKPVRLEVELRGGAQGVVSGEIDPTSTTSVCESHILAA